MAHIMKKLQLPKGQGCNHLAAKREEDAVTADLVSETEAGGMVLMLPAKACASLESNQPSPAVKEAIEEEERAEYQRRVEQIDRMRAMAQEDEEKRRMEQVHLSDLFLPLHSPVVLFCSCTATALCKSFNPPRRFPSPHHKSSATCPLSSRCPT